MANIEGRNPIIEALRSDRAIDKLMISNTSKEGSIKKVLRAENKVIVEGVNVVKKHVKPNGQTAGSIVEMEAPIHASNVMMIDPKTKKRTRIGHTIDKKGNKTRVAKKSNESLD